MIAKDCIYCDERENEDSYIVEFHYFCDEYYKITTTCGDDCPKYEPKYAKDNIKRFWEGK